MRTVTMLVFLILAAGSWTTSADPDSLPAAKAASAGWTYPEASRGTQVDDYNGVRVADPYRWLEDPDAASTRTWITAENRLTAGYLQAIPERASFHARLEQLWNYARTTTPVRKGGRYFFTRNDGLQNQNVLFTLPSLSGQPRMLLDPNTLSKDGTIALAGWEVSEDGTKLAYGLSSGGSDWQEWHVRDTATGEDLPDLLRWVKFSDIAWTHDNRGFFYARFAEPKAGRELEDANFYQKLYYHRLGTPQAEDALIYERPDVKELGFSPTVSDDGRYLVVTGWIGTREENAIFYKDLQKPDSNVQPLLDRFDATYTFIANVGPELWFQSTLDAPRSRVIAIQLPEGPETAAGAKGAEVPQTASAPVRAGIPHWREVLPQGAETLVEARRFNGRIIAQYLKDAHSEVRLFDAAGRPAGVLPLPGIGTVRGFEGEPDDPETFYTFESFIDPGTIYRYDLHTGKSTVFFRARTGFDETGFETRQVFFQSADGTRIPLFITCRKGLKLDGTHPTYLYGYGGFNISMKPGFSVPNAVWIERGGIYALANLRGGGEYGKPWHDAGSGHHKQNTFDDFIAAGQWLIAQGYTARGRLAIGGDSNGGLLAGAALTQRPDLFGAVRVGVGVLDMLRFDKFTIGWGWVSDYGSPGNPEDFKTLYAYSPYHNIRAGKAYPATLITTADHDDRVVPAHSFKFAAALQHAQGGNAPILIRIETRAGHGSGKPVSKLIEEAADELSFFWRALGMSAASEREAAGR